MARITKANAVKTKAKALASSKDTGAKAGVAEKRAQMKLVSGEKAATEKASGDKKLSQRLIETIEKRKQSKGPGAGKTPGKVPGRRGRRPKALAEYVPSTNEEENFSNESDYEGLEYDTGIRVKEKRDDYGFNMDRFEDFDEELNFDW